MQNIKSNPLKKDNSSQQCLCTAKRGRKKLGTAGLTSINQSFQCGKDQDYCFIA